MMRAEEILKKSILHIPNIVPYSALHFAVIKAMRDYAEECMKNSLEICYSNAKINYEERSEDGEIWTVSSVDKDSICNIKNIELL